MKTISNFIYKSDGVFDSWRVLKGNPKEGDCDDYAITTIYENEGRVVRPLLTGKYKIYLVIVPSTGNKHVVLRHGDQYIDNITQKWGSKPDYKFIARFPIPIIISKLLLGKVR